jgi:hypothetical protein
MEPIFGQAYFVLLANMEWRNLNNHGLRNTKQFANITRSFVNNEDLPFLFRNNKI